MSASVLRNLLFLLTFTVLSIPLLAQESTRISNPDSLFRVALSVRGAGDQSGADRIARRILADYPHYNDARVLVARFAAWAEDYVYALAQIDTVLSYDPRHQEARFLKATVYGWQGKYDDSMNLLLDLVEEAPRSSEYHAELAKVHLWQGKPKTAYDHYSRAYDLDSSSSEIIRGLARSSLRNEEYDTSLRWYRRLLQLSPRDGEAHATVVRLTYRSTHEIQLLSSYESFTRSGTNAHVITGLEYYHTWSADVKPFFHLSTLSKFGQKANRVGGGTYWNVSYSTLLLGQVILSPGSMIAPRVDGTLEVNHALGSGFELVAAYRFLSFDKTDLHVGSPGLTWYATGNHWITLRGYYGAGSDGSLSRSILLTSFHKPDERTLLRFGVFHGNETFRGVTVNEIAIHRSTGAFLSAKRRLTKLLALELFYQFASRRPVSNSHLFNVNASFLF